jgi:hypothetical protein
VNVDVRSVRQQFLNRVRAIERGGKCQRRLTVFGFHRVDVRAMFNQQFYRADIARPCGHHQRGHAIQRRAFRVRACLQKDIHNSGIAALAGHEQRSVATEPGGRFDIGSGVNQQLGQVGVAIHGGPMKSGHAVALCGIDVDGLLEESPDAIFVFFHGQIGNPGISGC